MSDIECAFTGRLTADPVERVSKSGKPWLSANVAVGSGDDTQFVSVALFGDSVPEVAPRLKSGERVYVEGKINLRTWTDRDGKERAGLSVASFKLIPTHQIGRRKPAKSRDGQDGKASRPTAESGYKPTGASYSGDRAGGTSNYADDQIPF